MKLDLKLLSMRLSQTKDEPPVSTNGVNTYLLENIFLPFMNNDKVYIRDIDYEAFDLEDIDSLQEYYDNLSKVGGKLRQLVEAVRNLPPEAQKARSFC